MRFEELGIKVGDMMQVEIVDAIKKRHAVKVVGYYIQANCLITTLPIANGKMIRLADGKPVNLRFAINNAVSAFSSHVLSSQMTPFPLLMLAIPKNVETVEVRKSARAACGLVCTLVNETESSETMTAKIVDLSPTGAKVESSKKLAYKNDELSLTFTIPFAEVEQTITVDSKVRAITELRKEDRQYFHLGMQFLEIGMKESMFLHGYVYYAMLKNINML